MMRILTTTTLLHVRRWTSEEGQIRVNNQPFHLKGE